MKNKIIFPELSYLINGICFNTHNELGRFAREKQYANKVETLFKDKKINYKREYRIGNSGNIADFLVDNKIILELKAQRIITKDNYFQVQRYLQSSNIKLGILVNFRNKYLIPRRVINYKNTYKNLNPNNYQ